MIKEYDYILEHTLSVEYFRIVTFKNTNIKILVVLYTYFFLLMALSVLGFIKHYQVLKKMYIVIQFKACFSKYRHQTIKILVVL